MSTSDVAALWDTAERAFARDDWPTAFTSFRAASEAADLSADQWYSLAESAWWLGEIDVALDAWKRAHDDYVALGDLSRAAMSALFLACHSLERGDTAAGSGWMHRTRRLLDDAPEGRRTGTRSTSGSSRNWRPATSTRRCPQLMRWGRSADVSTTRTLSRFR